MDTMKVDFFAGRNGGVFTKINGVISLPERGGIQPKQGEVWEVAITGQNPTGSVNFMRCIEPLVRCDRCAADPHNEGWRSYHHTHAEQGVCEAEHEEKQRIIRIAQSLPPNGVWAEGGKGISPDKTEPGNPYVFDLTWFIRENTIGGKYVFSGPEAEFATVEAKRIAAKEKADSESGFAAELEKYPAFRLGSVAALDWARKQFEVE